MTVDSEALLVWQPLRELAGLYQASDQREMRDRVVTESLCAGVGDPDLFFPEKGRTDVTVAAIQVCLRCPVRTECLALALRRDERHGIFGGTTPRDRQALIEVIKTRINVSQVPNKAALVA